MVETVVNPLIASLYPKRKPAAQQRCTRGGQAAS